MAAFVAGEVYVVCAQSTTTSKLWEGNEGGREAVVSVSDSWSTSKGPVYDIRSSQFVGLTGK